MSGGAARAVQRIRDGLVSLGVESSIYTLHASEGGEDIVRFNYPHDIRSRITCRWRARKIHQDFSLYLNTRPQGLELFSDDRSKFASKVMEQMPRCDIIHLHWVAGFLDYASFFAALDQPVIWTLHDMAPFTGGCHYNLGCTNFRDQCGICPQLGSSERFDLSHTIWDRKKNAFSNLYKCKMHVVATSQWMMEEARSSSLFAGLPVSVIPLGLDTDTFFPCDGLAMRSALGIHVGANVILFVADSISNRRKGFSHLIQSLNGMCDQDEIVLLTIGGSACNINGTFRHIHLGSINSDRLLVAAYSAADVFVIPSLQEAFGQTVLEAMACGVPVVGFDTGGIPDMVRSGQTGLLAPVGNVTALRQAIETLIHDPDLRGQIGRHCRDVVETEYRLDIQARRYMSLYQEVIER